MLYQKTEKMFLSVLDRTDTGTFTFENQDGRIFEFAGKFPGPHGHLKIHTPDVLWNMAIGGDTALAGDYRAGKWDSDNISELVDFAFRNEEAMRPFVAGNPFKRALVGLAALMRPNTRRRARANVMAHYDLGNDFYSLWLDDTMSYSSALFASPDETLEAGQFNKYDRILDRLGEHSGEVLEIGCGWGGFAERAIQRDDRRVTGLTLSPAQAQYARERLCYAPGHADIRLEDYREDRGRFNAIVSIEMFEAVGERYWKTYFERLASQLASTGKAVIQTITVDNDYFESYRKGGDAVRAYIFPGGMLPSENRFAEEAGRAGLRVTGTHRFGQDYATTLDRWLAAFDAKLDDVRALGYDEKFIRLWRFYLASCAGTFRCGRTDVIQVDVQHG
jgi:cyclopropane-fatty-acyl-phospholipid synthase